MRIDEDFTFPAHYAIDIAPGWPETREAIIHVPAGKPPLARATGDLLSLRFYATGAPSWFGEFEVSGRNTVGSICSTPNPHVAFVLSGWQAYRVNVVEKSVMALSTYPVRQMKPDLHRELIWLAGFSHIEAVNAEGSLQWKSERFFYDDLRILEIYENSALIEGFDGDTIAKMELKLKDGRIVDKLPHG